MKMTGAAQLDLGMHCITLVDLSHGGSNYFEPNQKLNLKFYSVYTNPRQTEPGHTS